MTLESLLYNIGKVAIRNKVINYAAAGSSIYELNADTITDYPILFASPTGQHEVRTNTTDFEITLYYLDRLLQDSSNDVQIFSTAVEQLKFMLRVIEEIEGVVEIGENYTISNFTETESMNDRVAGAYATVTITVMNVSECDTDMEIADSIFRLQDKYLRITENGTYSVTYDSQYEGLDKVEVLVEVPDLNGSYDEGYADGTAAGYEDGYDKGHDEGFIEGKDEGLTEGYGSGYAVGYEAGNAEGTAAGYADGKEDGYNEGYQVGQNEGVEDYVETLPTLDVTENGTYDTINKGVTVNVIPKINVQETGLKLGYSTFTEIPEWLDWSGITNLQDMFYECNKITTAPLFDTSKVTNMKRMFQNCTELRTIPKYDTSNLTDMTAMFFSCMKLTSVPAFDTSKVKTMDTTFNNIIRVTSLPAFDCSSIDESYGSTHFFGYAQNTKLTDLGGFIGLKTSSDSSYAFTCLPNLTYQSCINVLNGLYDFTGNGETPNSKQGKLKVHANFITTVGSDISIGTNKGWTITA